MLGTSFARRSSQVRGCPPMTASCVVMGKAALCQASRSFCVAGWGQGCCSPGQAERGGLRAGSGWRLRRHTRHELLHSWADSPPRPPELCQGFLLLLLLLVLVVLLSVDVVRGLLLQVVLLGVGVLLHFPQR